MTAAGEHLGRRLRSRSLRIPRRDQACGSLLRLISIIVTEEALRLLLLLLFLATLRDSLDFAT